MKRNPVARSARTALTDVNAREVRVAISVKIGDGKMGRHLSRRSRLGRPPPGKRQESAQGCEGPEGRLPNKTCVNPRSHEIQFRNPRRIDRNAGS